MFYYPIVTQQGADVMLPRKPHICNNTVITVHRMELNDTFANLFIYSLLNNAFSVTEDYTVSKKRIIGEWWIGKYVEGSGHGLI
jgi:hypothetical protein